MSRAGAADRGFTLIELLVVLTIVALLASVALPQVRTLLRPDIDRTTRTVALAIRDQRSTAMRTGTMADVTAAAIAPLLPNGTELAEDGLGAGGLNVLPQRHLDRRPGRAGGGRRKAGGQRRLADRPGHRDLPAVSGRQPGRGDDGFTLLETLVALAILGVVMSTVYGVIGSGLRSAHRDEDRLLLGLVAQNLLVRSRLDLDPAGGSLSGDIGGGLRWRIESEPYEVPEDILPEAPPGLE